MSRSRRRAVEGGSASVLVAAAVAALLVLTGGALVVGSAVLASHRARAAADLAALAGAMTVLRGEGATAGCVAAAGVARRNEALLRSCRAGPGGSLDVDVVVAAALTGGRSASASARAGPAQASPG